MLSQIILSSSSAFKGYVDLFLVFELDRILKDLIKIGILVQGGLRFRKLKMIKTIHFKFA